jgi:hypothetical protein
MSAINESVTTLEAAQNYISIGWTPVPIPLREKGPIIKGWQNLRLTASDLTRYFSASSNIGLMLGEASGGLVDIDLDALEAVHSSLKPKWFTVDTANLHPTGGIW